MEKLTLAFLLLLSLMILAPIIYNESFATYGSYQQMYNAQYGGGGDASGGYFDGSGNALTDGLCQDHKTPCYTGNGGAECVGGKKFGICTPNGSSTDSSTLFTPSLNQMQSDGNNSYGSYDSGMGNSSTTVAADDTTPISINIYKTYGRAGMPGMPGSPGAPGAPGMPGSINGFPAGSAGFPASGTPIVDSSGNVIDTTNPVNNNSYINMSITDLLALFGNSSPPPPPQQPYNYGLNAYANAVPLMAPAAPKAPVVPAPPYYNPINSNYYQTHAPSDQWSAGGGTTVPNVYYNISSDQLTGSPVTQVNPASAANAQGQTFMKYQYGTNPADYIRKDSIPCYGCSL